MKFTKFFVGALAVAAMMSCGNGTKKCDSACADSACVAVKVELPIAVQLYSVRGDMEADFVGTLAKVKGMGYDGVEFAGLDDCSGDDLKEGLERYGLECCGAYILLPLLQERYDEFVGVLKKLNAPSVCAPIPSLGEKTYDGWKNFAIEMNEMGKKLAADGIRLGYHNHTDEYEKFDGKYAIDIVLENCDPENVFFELDTRHTTVAGCNPVEFAKKYAGRIPFLHAKDTDMTHDTAVGSGVIDFEKVVKAADGVEWMIVENENSGRNLEELRQSVKYIRGNF